MFTITIQDAEGHDLTLEHDLDGTMLIHLDTTRITELTRYLRTLTEPTRPTPAFYTDGNGEIITTTIDTYRVTEGRFDITDDIHPLVWK